MYDLRPWAAAALLCAALGCTRAPPRPVTPPDSPVEIDDEARMEFAEVLEHYRRARRSGPLDARQCERIATRFESVADRHPATVETALLDAAVVREECGATEAAMATYERLVTLRPRSAKAHNNLGVLKWSGGQQAAALVHFKTAIDLDPHAPEPRNNLGAALRPAYVESGVDAAFLQAEDALRVSLALRSDDVIAYENLARLYYDRGRLHDRSYLMLADLVITQGQRVTGQDGPGSAELANLRGLLFVEQGDPIHAMKAFRSATEIDPGHVQAHMNGAMIAIRFRDFRVAERSLTRALADEQQRRDPDTHLGLGIAQRGLRKYADAARSFERAHAAAPSDPRALYNLGILYSEHVAPSKDGFDEASYRKAIGYFESYVAAARGGGHTERIEDARSRTKSIRELIRITESMEELEARARRDAEAQAAHDEAERRRLLELERKAMESSSE
jgi:tetratricopeptide (TPR) repeat protein